MGFEKVIKQAGELTGMVIYRPANFNPATKYTTILLAHGQAERGDGSDAGLTGLYKFLSAEWNNLAPALDYYGNFVLVAPQLPFSYGWWTQEYLNAGYDYAINKMSADPKRIALVVISLGGGALATGVDTVAEAQRFSCVVAICAVGGWGNKMIADTQLPVWAFHANDDQTVLVVETNSAVSNINQYATVKAHKTIFPTGGHFIWALVFNKAGSPGNQGEQMNVYEWIQKNTVDAPYSATNLIQAPAALLADAGPDIVIDGANTATLNGTASKGYKAAWWQQLWPYPGGVPKNYFADGNGWGIKKDLANLIAGEYTYMLTVADSNGGLSNDTVKVTVKVAGAQKYVEIKSMDGLKSAKVYEGQTLYSSLLPLVQ